MQNSITKLKDDVTAFDGKTKKQFEDIENHIKEVSNSIAHLDLSNYATKEDLQKVQPDFSKIVLQTKILDSNNKVAYTEHALSKSNDGTWKACVGIESTIPARVKNLCNTLPKIQEKIGNLQSTKADKSELSNYATKTDLNNKTERPLFEAMLQNYATKSELNNHQVDLSNYATKSDLDHKADRSDFSYYATKNELDIKADKSELSNYAKTGDITTAIQNVQIKQDSIDKEGKFTDSKVYSPTFVNGCLVFDLTDSYTTWYVANFKNEIANMQQQLEELKKKSLSSGKFQ